MDNRTYMHLCAFRESLAAGSTYTQINGVADQILSLSSSSNFFAPRGATIYAAFGGGTDASRQRINVPNLREIGFPSIAPLGTGTTIASPPNLAVYGDMGPMPNETDEISVEAVHSNVGAHVQWAVMLLKFGHMPVPSGRNYRLRATASVTAVVGSWASGALTLDQNLPAGNYAITGIDAFGTNLLAARLIFPGGGWRPGCMARNSVSSVPHTLFNSGKLGVLGVFNTVAVPSLEVYAEAANSSQEVYLDVTKVP